VDADSVTVSFSVAQVVAEGYFDGLRVEAEGTPPPNPFAPGGQAPAPAAQAPTPPAQGAPVAPALSATPLPVAPSGIAASAPRKTVEDDGILFSPEIAAVLGAARRKGATERSYIVLGPGAPLRELGNKPLGKWTPMTAGSNLSGAAATAGNLLSGLPSFVVAHKAEVVLVAGGVLETHKLAYQELYDWVDVAKVCLRLGVTPVFVLPPAGPLDELRRDMLEAAKAANCPAVDLKNATLGPLRLQHLLDLLEVHVFDRAPKAPSKNDEKKGPAVE